MTQPSVKQFVTFFPSDELVLRMHQNGKEHGATISMRNTFHGQVGFKFRANNYKDITVTPSKGVLNEFQEKTVSVVYSSRDPTQNPPEKLQVLVTPLDEQCSSDHNVQDLFTRALRKDIQEHVFPISLGPPLDEPQSTETQKEVPKQPQPLKDRPHQTAPLPQQSGSPHIPHVVPLPVPSTSGGQSVTRHTTTHPKTTEAILQESYRDTVFLDPGETDHQDNYYTWKSQPGTRTPSIKPGDIPHYELHLSSNHSKLPLGKRLIRNFSQIGTILGDLSEQSRRLRESQKWCFIIFWVFLIFLCLLVCLIALPMYKRRQRKKYFGDISLAQAAVEEVGETFIENRKGLTLDELIHAKMT